MDRIEDCEIYRRIPVRIMGAYRMPPELYLLPAKMAKLVAEFSNKNPPAPPGVFHMRAKPYDTSHASRRVGVV